MVAPEGFRILLRSQGTDTSPVKNQIAPGGEFEQHCPWPVRLLKRAHKFLEH